MLRRQQWVERVSAERHRSSRARSERAQAQIDRHLEWLHEEIKNLDEQMQAQLNQSQQQQPEILPSVPGVGVVTASSLVALLPELGQLLGHEPIAVLVGVAPINCDHGRLRGKCLVMGGRSAVCAVLYMAALVVIRFHPVMQAFYQRLLTQGKPQKLALVVCMRQLLVMFKAIRKHNQSWQPQPPAAAQTT